MARRKSVFGDRDISKGISFGLVSGIITVLGMIVGLETATKSRLAVIAGIVSIAVADAMSDSFGIHVSEEAEGDATVWKPTLYTLGSKFAFALLFLIPFIIFDIFTAAIISIILGLLIIGVYSYIMADIQKKTKWKVVGEHLLIAVVVIVVTYFVGTGVGIWVG